MGDRIKFTRDQYRCPNCPWFRDFPTTEVKGKRYDHPLHGSVTMEEGARKDIARHDCEEYRRAVDRLFDLGVSERRRIAA